MTTLTTTAGVPARARWALASEWVKLRSVRSTYLTLDRKSTRLNSSHIQKSRMPSSA